MTSTQNTSESKFRMILLAAKRARQLQSGAKPLVHTTSRKPTRIAWEEITAGVLPYEVLRSEGSEEEEKKSLSAAKK
ncbi:MAG TPA: DNA-directed RNA polymerase subunit omega [Terriglobia bacterium]|nr:DNA-directed RNA polymerase subunit omega [Terriglobia bacterium]